MMECLNYLTFTENIWINWAYYIVDTKYSLISIWKLPAVQLVMKLVFKLKIVNISLKLLSQFLGISFCIQARTKITQPKKIKSSPTVWDFVNNRISWIMWLTEILLQFLNLLGMLYKFFKDMAIKIFCAVCSIVHIRKVDSSMWFLLRHCCYKYLSHLPISFSKMA